MDESFILLNINIEQLEMLENTHAYLTDAGWVIPDWLVSMRKDVEMYEAQRYAAMDPIDQAIAHIERLARRS